MADIVSPEQRSRNMSAIRSKDTKMEIYFRKLLFARGLRYRKNANNIFGHPDLYFAKYRTAIFLHGCFWHRHQGCQYSYMPKSRTNFWKKKFEANVARDRLVIETLRKQDLKCLIIWECTVKKMKQSDLFATEIVDSVIKFLKSDVPFMEL